MIKDLTSDEEKIIELYRSLDDYRKQVGYMNLVLLQTCKEIDEQPCEIIDYNSGNRYNIPDDLAKCTKLDGETPEWIKNYGK